MNSKKHFKSFVDKVHERLNEEKHLLLVSSDEEDEKGRRTPILLETFGNDDVVIWIELFAKYPSIQNVSGMRIQLERATEEWMERFLSHDGLECLLEALEILSNAKKYNILTEQAEAGTNLLENAVMFLECIGCIKAVMKSNLGLEYFTSNVNLSKNIILGKLKLYSLFLLKQYRSSQSQMFFKIAAFSKCLKFHRKSPVLESPFNKVTGPRPATLLKRNSNIGVFL